MPFSGNAILTALRGGFDLSSAEIAAGAGLTVVQASHGCAVLLRRALIAPAVVASRVRPRYRITPEGAAFLDSGRTIASGPTGPTAHHVKRASLREKIWRALTMTRKGTVPELLRLARSGGEKQAENNARKYLAALQRAGYVVPLTQRRPGTSFYSRGFICWLLVKDTGLLAPVYCSKKRVVFDPNTKEEVTVTCRPNGNSSLSTQWNSTEAIKP
jgi:hypothetical protein